MDFRVSEHVIANFGDGKDVVAHVHGPAFENSKGETKYPIQAPDGTVADLGYREPNDPNNTDPGNKGDTFWSVPS